MGRTIRILIVTLLISWFGTGKNWASITDSISEPDTANLLTFTLFPESDPFHTDEYMHITLKFDMRKFIREKHKEKYHDAILGIEEEEGGIFEDSIRIIARGEFRKKSEFEEVYMNDIKTLKLVTYCKNSETYQQYILKEFMVYRMFNILTDNSYRVRLIEIEYIDSKAKKPSLSKYGFIIESNNHLAKRIEAVRIEREGITTWQTEQYQTNLMVLFQFMIGNSDWAIKNQHNIRLFKQLDHPILTPLAVPYDFDYSGMVNTYYAIPPEELGIESVRERIYRGYCLRSEAEYQKYIRIFLEHKEELYSLVRNFNLLDERHRKEMLVYLDEYYEIIENPVRVKREIMDACQE
ncbi:hypothetical protein LCGC14_2374050, partial [marine sediment metagenome]